MQYLSQNSKLTWGNKKRIRGMSIQERDDASIAFVTVFVGSRCFLISIWSGNLGWVSDKARRVLTTYCAGLFIIGLSQILWSCVCKSASFRNPYGLKYFLPQAGSTKAQTYIIYIYPSYFLTESAVLDQSMIDKNPILRAYEQPQKTFFWGWNHE
jgi:hypothetical protein